MGDLSRSESRTEGQRMLPLPAAQSPSMQALLHSREETREPKANFRRWAVKPQYSQSMRDGWSI